MRHYRLGREEKFATGFTDLFVLTHEDFISTVAGATETKTLLALAIGDMVMNNALLEVKTNANVLTQAAGQFGMGTGPNKSLFILDADLLAAGVEYFSVSNAVAPYVETAGAGVGANLTFSIVPAVGETTAAMTAGEFWIWTTISRKAQRNLQA